MLETNSYRIGREGGIKNMIWNDIKDKVLSIPNKMWKGQLEYLFNKTNQLPNDAIIIEIGSYKGGSSAAIGYACIETNRKLFCIDEWNEKSEYHCSLKQWQQTIMKNGLEKFVFPIKGLSQEILPHCQEIVRKEVDFVFIDGSHKYKDVLQDFVFSFSLLKKKGFLAMHDVSEGSLVDAIHPGVWRVWNKIALTFLVDCEYYSNLACGQKTQNHWDSLSVLKGERNE